MKFQKKTQLQQYTIDPSVKQSSVRLLLVYCAVSERNQTEYRVKLYRDLGDQIIVYKCHF